MSLGRFQHIGVVASFYWGELPSIFGEQEVLGAMHSVDRSEPSIPPTAKTRPQCQLDHRFQYFSQLVDNGQPLAQLLTMQTIYRNRSPCHTQQLLQARIHPFQNLTFASSYLISCLSEPNSLALRQPRLKMKVPGGSSGAN